MKLKFTSALLCFLLLVLNIVSCKRIDKKLVENYSNLFFNSQFDSLSNYLSDDFKISFEGGEQMEGSQILGESISNHLLLEGKYVNSKVNSINTNQFELTYTVKNWQFECYKLDSITYIDRYQIQGDKVKSLDRSIRNSSSYDPVFNSMNKSYYHWLDSMNYKDQVYINGSAKREAYFKYLKIYCNNKSN